LGETSTSDAIPKFIKLKLECILANSENVTAGSGMLFKIILCKLNNLYYTQYSKKES